MVKKGGAFVDSHICASGAHKSDDPPRCADVIQVRGANVVFSHHMFLGIIKSRTPLDSIFQGTLDDGEANLLPSGGEVRVTGDRLS